VERRAVKESAKRLKVREVRLVFQEAMAHEFKQCVRDALGREVLGYHSQLTLEPDYGFEFFILGD